MSRRFKVQIITVAALLVLGANASAQVARVSNNVWGEYFANTSLDISIGGNPLPTYNSTQWFYSGGDGNSGTSTAAVPAPAVISQSRYGSDITSPWTVQIDARAGTTWGANHTYASISGFDQTSTSSSTTLCPTIPGTGNCIPGAPEQTQTFSSYNSAYANSQSRWEEIYQTAGGAGALTMGYNIHASLGASTSGSGAPYGTSTFYWHERDFGNNTVAQFYGGYDAGSDSWWAQTFSNDASSSLFGWHTYLGTGSLTVGGAAGMTLVSSDGVSFSGEISGNRAFATGEIVYVDSFAQSWVSGNGISDAENTVMLTKVVVPTGIRILAQSGADYGGVVTGGGGLCTTSSCMGGGGGGTPPIPEPETYAMLLSGLFVIGFVTRRRRQD
ncbi:PEP-CTERM sorting domain-containing protein [Paucibacter sp. TC2R-5]|uniref:PEP-CTERM sorting domain-containing protein n=1 Tax=Paucibacter sp. TC2R-5 TaxID=2893555 RepID=UPI0021E480CE|nr:PEP-CTERM sorting domain-containing protein [Paucibacter sp. TC2R-5]MCV2358237.1 PEP-CTERM sorting domain-containing protein [Paucibacter sp. TC2R-5]